MKVKEVLKSLGFVSAHANDSAFKRQVRTGGKEVIIIALYYVDDPIFTGKNDEKLTRVMADFLGIFDGKLYDSLSCYSGLRTEWRKRSCKVSQAPYVLQILQEYAPENVRRFTTPTVPNFYEELERHKNKPVDGVEENGSMTGALIYLSTRSCPDIAIGVGILSRYQSKPNKFLLMQLKCVFGYLKGSMETGIVFEKHSELQLTFYCALQFTGLNTDCKSQTGWAGVLNEILSPGHATC